MTTASTPPAAKSKLRYVTVVVRLLMALIFIPAGAMYFLNMMPEPNPPPPKPMMDFATALMNTGYLFGLIKGVELTTGLLFLLNRFVPLALVVLAPVALNIVLVNLKLGPSAAGVITSAVIVAFWFYLAIVHRAAFRPLLTAKFSPAS